MNLQIKTELYQQLEKRAKANNIPMTDLINSLLSKMLNNHHKELKEIIETIKQRGRK